MQGIAIHSLKHLPSLFISTILVKDLKQPFPSFSWKKADYSFLGYLSFSTLREKEQLPLQILVQYFPLRRVIRCGSILHRVIRCGSMLAPRCWMRQYTAPRCQMRQYAAPRCQMRQYTASRYQMRQYTTPRYQMRQYAAPKSIPYATRYSTRIAHLAAKCCQILPNTAKILVNFFLTYRILLGCSYVILI